MHDAHTIPAWLVVIFLFLFFCNPYSYADEQNNLNHTAIPMQINQPILNFIQRMVKKHHFKAAQLQQWFQHTLFLPDVIRAMQQPFEKKPWSFYRQHFVCEKFIQPGASYWQQHNKTLQKVKKQYGVDPAIIVAIIGIESHYGEVTGTYQEIGALTTLAFHYPARAKFFQKELEQYLLLTRQQHLQILKIQGSYAGALGIPQFMPSSYRHYGVNFSRNKYVDLFANQADAIASIANYLRKAHWQTNQAIVIPALTPKEFNHKLISSHAKPRFRLKQLQKYGIYPNDQKKSRTIKKNTPIALIALDQTSNPSYWLALPNFRVIMRYNTSVNYAMAVYELSQAIRKAYEHRAHQNS